ncbi:hypothetical protein LCGC14_0470540 [marine sediment metagenome]|uniref:Uncharacterized protein n=1 Tax=marine sediment metagenome TaxID=412755 RepID=A0A0F9SCC4_9ZZZZ
MTNEFKLFGEDSICAWCHSGDVPLIETQAEPLKDDKVHICELCYTTTAIGSRLQYPARDPDSYGEQQVVRAIAQAANFIVNQLKNNA